MKKAIVVLSFSVTIFYVSGCKSVSAENNSAISRTAVIHEIKYSSKGSKSEGRSGYLNINNVVIPDCFIIVVADKKIFIFKMKSTILGDDGYFLLEGATEDTVYPVADSELNDADLAKGWCEVSNRYSNIPDHWIFVRWDNGSAFISPDRIETFVKAKSLKVIPRNIMFKGKILK